MGIELYGFMVSMFLFCKAGCLGFSMGGGVLLVSEGVRRWLLCVLCLCGDASALLRVWCVLFFGSLPAFDSLVG